jgi:hypothetical protein
MKKLIALFIVVIVTALYAQQADVTITLVIPGDKVADFAAGFLAAVPIPTIEEDGEMVDEYTPKQWIREWLRREAVRAYRHGKKKLAIEAAITDPNVLPE